MSTHLERHVRRFEDDPADSGAFEALEERYFREGAWSDLVPLYERRLEGCGEALEPPERARLLFRLGQALDEGLDRPEAAAERVRQAIELDPNFAPAIRLLRRQASALGDWSTALAMIERELALTERDDEMVRLQAELGEVALGCAGDPERALRAFNTALTAEPEQPMALAGRARALEALERPQDAAVAWEEALARLEGETRDHAVRDFGRLLEGELGDRDRALDLYEAAHEAAPLEPEWQEAIARVQGLRAAAADGPAVADAPTPAAADREPGTPPGPTARAVAEAPQRRGGLSDVRREVARLEQAAGLAETDSAERARLLVQIGEAQEHRLRDLESACDAYQLAFTLAPELPGLALALDRVLRALGLLEELAPVLERAGQAEGAPESERVQVFCSLGALRLDHQDDPLRAADAFEAALALDPGHATALEGLVRAARASGDPDALLRACEREAVTCAAERLPELVAQIVSLCGAREDLERALPAAGRWAQERPQERAALETLAHVLGEAGHTEELAGCLERLDALLDGPERAANRRRLGYLHAAEGRTEGAIDAWRAALEAEPSDEASLEALVDALSEAERYDELIRLFDQRPTTRARESRAVALARARALEATGHREEALALYRELRSVYLGVPEVEQAFERLARALGDADALAEALGERVRTERDADARARLQLERAELLDTDLGRGEEARALYAAVLDANPETELAERAVARLEALLERLGAFDELVDRLGARAREGSDAELEARIAELAAARLGDASRALEHLERALALQPERGDWWRRLGALLGDDGDPAQQLRAIEGELAAGPEAERAHALHQRAGRLAAGPLADPERASAHYEPVLEVEPGHAEACEFLIALHGDAGRFAELEPLLRARLAALDGPEEVERRTGLRLRLAALLVDELDRPEEAVAALEAGRRDAGPTPAIAGALADLYERLRHWTPLGALCEEAAERAARPEERAVWLVRLGHAERASGRGAEAIAAYRRALEAR
ncbi:MAG: hypothetical protein QNK03_20570, partial [Myxococcota bacterium]|nr:hypothetical protein [Myxococcota bacterium]